MPDTKVALIGAGAIGRAHLVGAAAAKGIQIIGIADPNPAAESLAKEFSVPWFKDHRTLLDDATLDGAIIATPNRLHVPIALEFIAAGKAVLVEKPVSDTIEDGLRLGHSAAAANIPVLVGHHRRHNPILKTVRAMIRDGKLGQLVSASVLSTFLKPDSYFNETWRRSAGAGPILINLIHEIDLLRYICGEIDTLQAMASNKVRGFEVEDTAAALLKFANGALGTLTLSDTAVSPWAWDLASGEGHAFAKAPVESHFITGTEASVALPSLRMWRYPGERGWFHPLSAEFVPYAAFDPYTEQMRHFGAVIRREETPVTDAFDATKTLEVTLAVRAMAASGGSITFAH